MLRLKFPDDKHSCGWQSRLCAALGSSVVWEELGSHSPSPEVRNSAVHEGYCGAAGELRRGGSMLQKLGQQRGGQAAGRLVSTGCRHVTGETRPRRLVKGGPESGLAPPRSPGLSFDVNNCDHT